jgi:hypothetical protein
MKIGICGLLFVALVLLKALNLIAMSWFWVWSPIWIPFGVAMIFALALGVFVLIKTVVECARK